jgi:hypothetical protein
VKQLPVSKKHFRYPQTRLQFSQLAGDPTAAKTFRQQPRGQPTLLPFAQRTNGAKHELMQALMNQLIVMQVIML